ncbi:polyprenyl diphosphate synthase [Aliikangiella coralliicola]|uniref:Ditrans,polycis-undecaprenyl-diphosphate synthase ((2E,6E)-farnesyl-diphosphate specific) n=1 Tax=Aliikangiella coralliicola TaxID=2592383 RepID=A0A545UB03_9GAMM|nr:polyprenyl diphosphate synthase [Aliikangiella coralliicola]TQV86641.1 di-trans,poly-cis-decaprenylcistransferase [Aliikangiella coralliicola]
MTDNNLPDNIEPNATSHTLDEANKIPKHIAIIMDGNGRWAQARGKKRTRGHKAGVERAREIVETSGKLGVESLTLFAFSSENWQRPQEEVSYLMELFVIALNREVKMLNKHSVKLNFLGDTSAFNNKLQESIAKAEHLTKDNDKLRLNIAANYGGRWDIVNSVNSLLQENAGISSISEELLDSRLATSHLPPLDLLIRTGGEVRISNFLIWQAAYAELYFCDTLWPDFDANELQKAVDAYAKRQRRYGKTGEQVQADGDE